eukprot:1160643-Pelagomonas_calceolata.AAC.5
MESMLVKELSEFVEGELEGSTPMQGRLQPLRAHCTAAKMPCHIFQAIASTLTVLRRGQPVAVAAAVAAAAAGHADEHQVITHSLHAAFSLRGRKQVVRSWRNIYQKCLAFLLSA